MSDSTLYIRKSTLDQALENLASRFWDEDQNQDWPTADQIFDECVRIENERMRTVKCKICGDPVEAGSDYCMRHEDI